jgi:hypothetical protein
VLSQISHWLDAVVSPEFRSDEPAPATYLGHMLTPFLPRRARKGACPATATQSDQGPAERTAVGVDGHP